MPGPADAEELEIDPAGLVDRLLVGEALLFGLLAGQVAARDVHVGGGNVEPGEKILPHEPMVGVETPRVHRVVLVEVEGDDLREAEPFVAVHPDQLAVNADRRRPGGEAQDRPARLAADQIRDPASDEPRDLVLVGEEDGADPLGTGVGVAVRRGHLFS